MNIIEGFTMRNTVTVRYFTAGFLLLLFTFVHSADAQFADWEAMPGLQAGHAAHMLDLGDGRILLSGPSSQAGRNGLGLYLYTPGNEALRDVTPSWGKVHALAMANDNSILFANDEGIWRSRDAERWTHVYQRTVTALNCLRDGNCYAAETDGTVLRSTDHGRTWAMLSLDVRQYATFGPPRQFAMNAKNWMICSLPMGNVVSLDGGENWSTHYGIDDSARISVTGRQPLLVTSDSGRVITSRYGASLHVMSGNWMHTTATHTFVFGRQNSPEARAIIEAPNGTLYCGLGTEVSQTLVPDALHPDSCGVLVSWDEGSSWKWLRSDIDVLNLLFTAEGDLLVSTLLDGFLRIDTADGSSTRLPVSYGTVTDFLFLEGRVFAAMDSCHVTGTLSSSDEGAHWTWSDTMRYTASTAPVKRRLTVMPDGVIRLGHAFVSRNNGRSWERQYFTYNNYFSGFINSVTGFRDGTLLLSDMRDGRENSFLYHFDANRQQIDSTLRPGLGRIRQVHAYSNDRLLVAAESGMYISTDRGVTFTQRFEENTLCLRELRDGWMIAGFDDDTYSHAYSSWGASTWERVAIDHNSGVIDADGWQYWLYVITAVDFDSLGEVVPGTPHLLRGTIDQSSWYNLTEGLPTDQLTAICLDEHNYLYVGTRGCGAFRLRLPVVDVEELPDATRPLTVSLHPQPAGDAMTITVASLRSGTMRATVHDLLGRRVIHLPDQDIKAGVSLSVRVDIAGLSPGSYLLVVTTTDGTRRVLPFLRQ
jgi:hypothetical protein